MSTSYTLVTKVFLCYQTKELQRPAMKLTSFTITLALVMTFVFSQTSASSFSNETASGDQFNTASTGNDTLVLCKRESLYVGSDCTDENALLFSFTFGSSISCQSNVGGFPWYNACCYSKGKKTSRSFLTNVTVQAPSGGFGHSK